MRSHLTIRVEIDPCRTLSFLQANAYGLEWTEDDLRDHCITCRVEHGPDVIAYVWASWITDGVLDLHACSSRRLWLDRETIRRFYEIAELFGAHTLHVIPRGPNRHIVHRLLVHHGFASDGVVLTKRLDEPTDGLLQRTQDTGRSADTGPATAAA